MGIAMLMGVCSGLEKHWEFPDGKPAVVAEGFLKRGLGVYEGIVVFLVFRFHVAPFGVR